MQLQVKKKKEKKKRKKMKVDLSSPRRQRQINHSRQLREWRLDYESLFQNVLL